MPKIRYEDFQSYSGVREGQEPSLFIVDPIQFKPYRDTYESLRGTLVRGTPIPDTAAVSVMGNHTLLETSFIFKPLDKLPIEGLDIRGKSAHIAHTDNVALAALTMTSRKGRREDSLFTVLQRQLNIVGISAIYAPTDKKLLHLRLVPEYYDAWGNIPEEIRVGLVELL